MILTDREFGRFNDPCGTLPPFFRESSTVIRPYVAYEPCDWRMELFLLVDYPVFFDVCTPMASKHHYSAALLRLGVDGLHDHCTTMPADLSSRGHYLSLANLVAAA
jgi:hypothetical protein